MPYQVLASLPPLFPLHCAALLARKWRAWRQIGLPLSAPRCVEFVARINQLSHRGRGKNFLPSTHIAGDTPQNCRRFKQRIVRVPRLQNQLFARLGDLVAVALLASSARRCRAACVRAVARFASARVSPRRDWLTAARTHSLRAHSPFSAFAASVQASEALSARSANPRQS